MPTALAISPHLDDAVFSAGGILARLAEQGWRVIVATVFTASVRDPVGFAMACQLDKGLAAEIDYMALRRDEDAAACALIGAEPLWLPFQEAPHRGYHSAPELFAGLRADDPIVTAITPAIAELVWTTRPDAVFAPQAIGAHVDHIAVHLASRSCHHRLHLWADFPYVSRPDHRPSPFAENLIGLTEAKVDLQTEELALKRLAVGRYASQIDFQFGAASNVQSALARSREILLVSPRHRLEGDETSIDTLSAYLT